MSIKEQIRKAIDMAIVFSLRRSSIEELDEALKLLDQLQEPQAPRRAPDYPEPGQLFWQEIEGEMTLCKASYKGVSWTVVGYWPDDPEFKNGWSSNITRWLPVVPPQFTEQGHD